MAELFERVPDVLWHGCVDGRILGRMRAQTPSNSLVWCEEMRDEDGDEEEEEEEVEWDGWRWIRKKICLVG